MTSAPHWYRTFGKVVRLGPALGLAALLGQGLWAQAPAPNPPRRAATLVHRNCATCHKNHRGMGIGATKAGIQAADQLCLTCHEGTNTAPSMDGAPKFPTWTGQGSGHIKNRFISRRSETFVRIARNGSSQIRLTQDCSGCHDVHGKESGKLRTTGFDARGQLLGRRPQSVAEICFGCHAGAEAALLPSGAADLGPLFTKGAASSHEVGITAAGRPDLPSLRVSAFQGKLDCTSCHDNPNTAGARGPHTSPHAALLKAAYGHEKDQARLGERTNDLCFLCHDKQSILANQSFTLHAQHLSGFTGAGSPSTARKVSPLSEAAAALGLRSPKDLRPGRSGAFMAGYGEPTPCATCHAPHGSMRQGSLVEFDRSVVSFSSVGSIVFQRAGLGRGSCTLSCHGHDHVQSRY